MNIARRTIYENRGRAYIKTDTKISINFNLDVLDLFCAYILSENRHIRKSHLLNLRNLILMLDMSLYASDPDKMKRIDFITKGLEGKLEKNIKNPKLLIKFINGGIMDSDVVDINSILQLSSDELEYINETVTNAIKYSFLYRNVDRGIDLLTRFKNADYRSVDSIVIEIEQFIDEIKGEFRRAKVDKMEDMMFTLRQGLFEDCMQDVHDILTNPSRRLITGLQGLNEMLNGGFESGRAYMFLGSTGIGKSLLLLNLIYQMKKANRLYKPKDPTKIPVIVLLTQENTVLESIQRLWDIAGFTDSMTGYTIDEVIRKLREEGELYLTDDSPIDIIIKYKGNRSIDTGYLYTLTEDLEDEGYEVIALFQDHIKRIRSAYPQPDLRIELGEVVNEMKVFAAIKDIPIITISHLNRDAAKIIETARNKSDLTRLLGKSNVGESMLMIDNIDVSIIVNVEYDKENHKYMIFNRIKMREKATMRDYICYPFVYGNGAKIVEDIGSAVPAFKESLHDLNDIVEKRHSVYSKIDALEDDSIEEEHSIFSRMASYSSDNIIKIPTYDEDDYMEPEPSMIVPFIIDENFAVGQ